MMIIHNLMISLPQWRSGRDSAGKTWRSSGGGYGAAFRGNLRRSKLEIIAWIHFKLESFSNEHLRDWISAWSYGLLKTSSLISSKSWTKTGKLNKSPEIHSWRFSAYQVYTIRRFSQKFAARQVASHAKETPKGWINQDGTAPWASSMRSGYQWLGECHLGIAMVAGLSPLINRLQLNFDRWMWWPWCPLSDKILGSTGYGWIPLELVW